MKFLALLILMATATAHASGCDGYDVLLNKEDLIITLPETYEISSICSENGCHGLSAYNSAAGYYTLISSENFPPFSKTINMKLNIYRQHFESSCAHLYRVVVGVDIDGVRFRSQEDLDYL